MLFASASLPLGAVVWLEKVPSPSPLAGSDVLEQTHPGVLVKHCGLCTAFSSSRQAVLVSYHSPMALVVLPGHHARLADGSQERGLDLESGALG